jgi:hypothetical protein
MHSIRAASSRLPLLLLLLLLQQQPTPLQADSCVNFNGRLNDSVGGSGLWNWTTHRRFG